MVRPVNPDDWGRRILRFEQRRRDIHLEVVRNARDRRRLLLLRTELQALIAEIEQERGAATRALAAVTTGQQASLAYLRIGRTISAAPSTPSPAKESHHVHRP